MSNTQPKPKPTQAGSQAVAVRPAPRPSLLVPDNRTAAQRYVDALAPSSMAGRLIKFSKEGQFTTTDDGAVVDPRADFLALCDETMVGWIKFSGDGGPPERLQGL